MIRIYNQELLQQAESILGEHIKGVTNLLTSTSHKIDKSNESKIIKTLVMYLAPATSAGLKTRTGKLINICGMETTCVKICLGIASGRMNQGIARIDTGQFDWSLSSVSQAMLKRTRLFIENRPAFYERLYFEIDRALSIAHKNNMRIAVRLNGTSDIRWESNNPELFKRYPQITYYDYTKYPIAQRLKALALDNYHLTYSFTNNNDDSLQHARQYLAANHNVAVVFGDRLPDVFLGYQVTDADRHDMRFIDNEELNIKTALIAGLIAKGQAKNPKHDGGFVVRPNDIDRLVA